jgi:hypothetical protein
MEPLFPVEALTPKGYIGAKGEPISTVQSKISDDKCSTGNKGSISDKGPFMNTEQGKISGDKGSTGNKAFIGDIDHLFTVEHFITLICIDGRSTRTFISC